MENNIEALKGIKNIHLIGIGGSGIFPIAQLLFAQGYNITGSDIYESDTLQKVRKMGITPAMKHEAQNIGNAQLVIYSAAIKALNPEIIEAKKRNIPCIERSEALGLFSKEYSKTIAVSGTHGKTTTTAMITNILLDCKKSPTAIIGGTFPRINGNSCSGDSNIMVCEACEYVDSFLKLYPAISIILNVDEDHLDYFKNLSNIIKSFSEFSSQTSELLIINGDDKNAVEATKDIEVKKIFYGFSCSNEFYAQNITTDQNQHICFDIIKNAEKIAHMSLSVPGKHNILNALAAFIACTSVGADPLEVCKSIKGFTGVHRRFEILGEIAGITVADDFSHHPTEIRATLCTAKDMGFNRVWGVFQPHTYSRTYILMDDFAEALSIADRVVISDILPVREVNTYGVRSEDLAQKIDNCTYLPTFEEISSFISENAQSGDLILTMGGGDVYKCSNMIVDELKKLHQK